MRGIICCAFTWWCSVSGELVRPTPYFCFHGRRVGSAGRRTGQGQGGERGGGFHQCVMEARRRDVAVGIGLLNIVVCVRCDSCVRLLRGIGYNSDGLHLRIIPLFVCACLCNYVGLFLCARVFWVGRS